MIERIKSARTDFLTLDDTVCDGTTKPFSSLLFVTIITGTIKKAISSLEGIVYSLQIRSNINICAFYAVCERIHLRMWVCQPVSRGEQVLVELGTGQTFHNPKLSIHNLLSAPNACEGTIRTLLWASMMVRGISRRALCM